MLQPRPILIVRHGPRHGHCHELGRHLVAHRSDLRGPCRVARFLRLDFEGRDFAGYPTRFLTESEATHLRPRPTV
eukprot:11215541-Lingulodinium_polyedra.AAC.1